MPGPSSPTAIVVVGAAVVGDQPHAAVGRRVADRVVEQVGQHLLEALGVAGRLEPDRVDLDPQPHRRARRARTRAPRARAARAPRSARTRSGARPTRAARGRAAARRGARAAASGRARRRSHAGRGSTPSARFSSTAWSAPIGVRSSCETLATRSRRMPLDVGEVGRHRVEGARELADLVARRRGHAPLVVAAGHRRGGRGHLAQRRGHAAREALDEREADHHGDHDAQPRRQPELVPEREDGRRGHRPRRRSPRRASP